VQRRLARYEDVARLYAALDAYVVPSRQEGGPKGVLEAMASGVPVVTTAVAGIPEVVTPGVQGLVERPHDVEGIAQSLATLLDDTRMRRRFGSAGRRAVQQQFDVLNSAAELAALYGAAPEWERWVASI
jgi:glycosyltransferase involved in cell wall biosynthesis